MITERGGENESCNSIYLVLSAVRISLTAIMVTRGKFVCGKGQQSYKWYGRERRRRNQQAISWLRVGLLSAKLWPRTYASLQSAFSRPHLGHSSLLHGLRSRQITYKSRNLTLSLLACLHMVSQPTCCIISGTTVWAFFLTSPLRSSKQEYKGATTATKVEGRFFSTGNFSSSQPSTYEIQTQIRQREQFKIQWFVRKVNTNSL